MTAPGESCPVVTGIGVASPLGIGAETFWESLCAGRSAIGEIRRFDPGRGAPRLGAEVADFPVREFLPPALVRRMDRVSQLIGVACVLAAADAGLATGGGAAEELGVVCGAALGNITESVQFLGRLFERGPSLASPMLFPNLVLNAAASQVAMALGWRGPNLTVSAAEISGEAALEAAIGLLSRGRARAVVVAAGEELAEMVFRTLKEFRYLSPRRRGRERSMPFDAAADGPVLGEGAAALVVESGDSAARRGARVRAVIESVERFSLPAPGPLSWPLPQSLGDPGCGPRACEADVGLCGADSSPERDALELALMGRTLREGRPLYALSGAVGTHAGLGLTTVAAAVLALSTGRLPPILGLEHPRAGASLALSRAASRGSWRRARVLGIARGGSGAAIDLRAADS